MNLYTLTSRSYLNHFLYAEKIKYHWRSISESVDKNIENRINRKLSNIKFWNKLKKRSHKIEVLYDSFKMRSSFAHLSAQEILQLKDAHIDPLKHILAYRLKVLRHEYTRFKENKFWRFWGKDKYYQKNLKFLEEQLSALNELENNLQATCLLRADLYELINVERQYDDVSGVFSIMLDRLNLLDRPLNPETSIRAGLDDDTRIYLFDWCAKNDRYDKSDLKKFISPINQNPYRLPLNYQEIEIEIGKLLKWCHKIKEKHGLNGAHQLDQRYVKKKIKKTWVEKIFFYQSWKKKLIPDWWSLFLKKLHKKRYWFAITAALFFHVFFSPIIVAASVFYFGQWSAVLASNLLFYGVTLLPLWTLLYKGYKEILQFINKSVSCRKVSTIEMSIEQLKINQKYINNRLTRGIVDISHFNTDILAHTVSIKIIEIDNLINAVKKETRLEKIFTTDSLNDLKIEVIEKLKQQKKCLKKRFEILSDHIAERVKDEILVLKNNADGSMVSKLSKYQILRLRRFVEQYGADNALSLFDANIDISPAFLTALQNNKFCFRENKLKLCAETWGGYRLKIPTIHGWRSLIGQTFLNIEKRKSALAILDIISGKKVVVFEELKLILLTIQNGNISKWYNAIVNHIFLNLDQMSASIAVILNNHKKKLIYDWYQDNKKNIQEAYDYFWLVIHNKDRVRSNIEDKVLASYFALLQGAEISYYSGVASNDIIKFKNHLEEYFGNYDGSHSKALYYTLFIPKCRKKDIIQSIAFKRLEWLLNNSSKIYEIEKADIELFKHPSLYMENSLFDFKNYILSHSLYHAQWNINIKSFLKLCQDCGLDSGKLLLHYKSIHKGERDFLKLSRIGNKKEAKEEAKEEKILVHIPECKNKLFKE